MCRERVCRSVDFSHDIFSYVLRCRFHWQKGGPVPTIEDASSRTQWEQVIVAIYCWCVCVLGVGMCVGVCACIHIRVYVL